MRLTLLTTPCGGGACPAVFATNRDTVIVKGLDLQEDVKDLIELGEHENGVEIPTELLKEVSRHL